MTAQHLTYEQALESAANRNREPVKQPSQVKSAATRRAQFLALRDKRLAELRGK